MSDDLARRMQRAVYSVLLSLSEYYPSSSTGGYTSEPISSFNSPSVHQSKVNEDKFDIIHRLFDQEEFGRSTKVVDHESRLRRRVSALNASLTSALKSTRFSLFLSSQRLAEMFALFFSALCSWFAFCLPCFATYKTLSARPIVEADVERWCMHWSVVGAFVGFEYLAGWFISWLPFYWEMKTVFLLFLSLPQTQGSTFVYKSYMQPFFTKNEKEIDAGIISIQSNIFTFVQTRLYGLWELLWSVLNKTPAAGQPPNQGANGQQTAAPAISLDAAMGLFKTYGPAFMNSLKPASSGNAPTPPSLTPRGSSSSVSTVAS